MRLFKTVIVRQLLAERLRAATTIIGIAMGIAVIVAVRLTNASSVRGFEAALELVSGRTSLEIVGVAGSFDELLLRDLGWLREYGDITPVIDGELVALPRDGEPVRMRLLGIDILREPPFRDYSLGDGDVTQPAFLELLLEPDSVIVTEKFAGPRGLKVGDSIRLAAGDRVREFTVRGLLRDEGPARAFDGHVVLTDIAAAQLAVDRLGRLDRLDLRVASGRDVAQIAGEIARRLPPALRVQRPSDRVGQAEKMLQAFQLNLEALSYIALLVGLFLIYNTVSVSVISRRDEIGMLRALGMTSRGVGALFLAEAGLLGTIGCAVGIVAGRFLAHTAVELTSTTVETLYVATAAAMPELTTREIVAALAIGFPLALVAGAIPAREAAAVPPVMAIRGNDRSEDERPRFKERRSLLLSLILLTAAAWMARRPAIDGRPIFGWIAAVLTVFGAAFLVPVTLECVTRLVHRGVHRSFQLEIWLANANMSAGSRRIAISVAALAVSLSMMVAIAVMIGSFRETVNYWVAQTLKADLYVSSGARPSRQSDFTISAEAERIVRGHPAVAAVDRFRREDMIYDGAQITLAAGDYDVFLQYGNLLFKAPTDGRTAMRQAIGQNAVVVSEPFAVRHHRNVGDTITLPTPKGVVPFRVAAVYYDYSADRGIVVLDAAIFARYFGERRPTSLAVYLRPGHWAETVRTELDRRLGERHRLFIQTNETLRREVLRVFDSTFAITYALEGVAIVVAMMGVATTLLTLILDRRREIAVLRLIGTARDQITRMVVVEAFMIGAVSQAIGLAVGMALSVILIFVINLQSFGWTIQWHTPWMFLIQASGLTLIATMLAGLVPARRAARVEFAEQLSEA